MALPPIPAKFGENCPVDENFDGSRKDGMNGEEAPGFEPDEEVPLEPEPDGCDPPDTAEKLGSVNVDGWTNRDGCWLLAEAGEPPAWKLPPLFGADCRFRMPIASEIWDNQFKMFSYR